MLNLSCVICAELFAGTDDVHATVCGHMFHFVCLKQWMERSKSCPQCRNKCTDRNIFRVYFNLSNLDTSTIDVGSLQEQLDNASLKIKMQEKELNKAEAQIKELKESQRKCAKTINVMEQKIQKHDFVVLSYQEQIKLMKAHVKAADEARREVEHLKRQLSAMESVQSILAASSTEVDKLLKIEKDPVRLCTWVATLKRELRSCETKKTELRRTLKGLQDNLREEMAKIKSFEERISQLESENYQLQEQVKTQQFSKPISTFNGFNELIPTNSEKRHTISPTIKENIKRIEESNSPYFNIKSSSIGLMPIIKRNQDMQPDRTANTTTKLATLKISPKKCETATHTSSGSSTNGRGGILRKTQSNITEMYSIMKKPRLNLTSKSVIEPLEMEKSFLPSAVPKSIGSSLDSRLKSGGLRNFKVSK